MKQPNCQLSLSAQLRCINNPSYFQSRSSTETGQIFLLQTQLYYLQFNTIVFRPDNWEHTT